MSLSPSVSITNGGTISVAGGTAKTFSVTQNQGNKVVLQDLSVTDMRVRPSVEVTVKTPVVSALAPNGYTQFRSSGVVKIPKLLANGHITVNQLKFELAADFEATDAEKQYLLDIGSQFAFQAALKSAFKDGVLA